MRNGANSRKNIKLVNWHVTSGVKHYIFAAVGGILW
jgi:hypothetical protein